MSPSIVRLYLSLHRAEVTEDEELGARVTRDYAALDKAGKHELGRLVNAEQVPLLMWSALRLIRAAEAKDRVFVAGREAGAPGAWLAPLAASARADRRRAREIRAQARIHGRLARARHWVAARRANEALKHANRRTVAWISAHQKAAESDRPQLRQYRGRYHVTRTAAPRCASRHRGAGGRPRARGSARRGGTRAGPDDPPEPEPPSRRPSYTGWAP